MQIEPLLGLVAATHTPFHADGTLNLSAVERQAKHLLGAGIRTVFIDGSTGESHSLSLDERLRLAARWMDVCRGTPLRVIVHVGANCLDDAATMAAEAGKLGVAAIAALAPSYFKPGSLDALVECCRKIALSAPETPFYYYDIPVLTGVVFSMPEFLEKVAARVDNFAGIKFTSPDLMAYQQSLRAAEGRFDIPWGMDESLLAALALGARGAVGSTYNFAAPLYQRLWKCFAAGDIQAAREEQFRSVQLIRLLASYGYMGAAKALMGMLGVDVGPARLPQGNPAAEQVSRLRGELERLGFFDWIRPVSGPSNS
jgi:N-acetylneuraminate lyase